MPSPSLVRASVARRSSREGAVVPGNLPLARPLVPQLLSNVPVGLATLGCVDEELAGDERVVEVVGAVASGAGEGENMPGRTRPPGWTGRRSGWRPNAPAFILCPLSSSWRSERGRGDRARARGERQEAQRRRGASGRTADSPRSAAQGPRGVSACADLDCASARCSVRACGVVVAGEQMSLGEGSGEQASAGG